MVKDYEIPMPKWEITDPLGRAALRRMRYELKRALCERDGYRVELEETLKARGAAVDAMHATLRDEQQRSIQLETWLKASDDARRSLGDKVRNMREEITKNETERAKLRVELERAKELYESLLKEHAQLQADHEKLVRSITDKEAEI